MSMGQLLAGHAPQVVGEMGFFFGMRHITHARAHSRMSTTLFALPKADYSQLVKLYPDQVRPATHKSCLHLGTDCQLCSDH